MLVEKKVRAQERHRKVADEFEVWLRKHPKATMRKKIQQFDFLCDSAMLHENLKNAE